MVDADVQDLKGEQDALKLVTERFRLDLTAEEASRYFQELINSSVGALFPQLVERLHSWGALCLVPEVGRRRGVGSSRVLSNPRVSAAQAWRA